MLSIGDTILSIIGIIVGLILGWYSVRHPPKVKKKQSLTLDKEYRGEV